MSLEDFRPISLVGPLYKLLAKVLASRLKRVMNSIIGDSQMAFIKNRQITNCLMIANEVIHKWKRDKVGGLLVKIDFEKAYDCVDHSFFNVYDGGIIRCLVLSSGLRINFNKSSIARVCKKESLNENWDFSFRCRKASLPITHLGLPLRDWMVRWSSFCLNSNNIRAWFALLFAVSWTIWESMNQALFKDIEASFVSASDMVKFRVAWWFKIYGRSSKDPISLTMLNIKDLCVEGSGSNRLKEEELWTPPSGSYPKSLSLLHGLGDAEVVYNPRSSNSFANKLEKMGSTNCGDRIS
ncbi:hypothetical protein Ddye_017116 [Dipteronia dyeriana]|uniref:Reverse transcriptase domain-containing protein n=1 Tax=Dipteronia dyeriana TaxID=168575 RepID=A0AAD9U835_9ROSI|nr:hypothetical protein Ddye_017116 [Dipteronia dyeriana]